MADLPVDRVTPGQPPFTSVGVDCFGPLQVRHGRSLVKRYGVIFTCLAIRAVHIEVAHSLETDSFLMALRRFLERRGQVRRSDPIVVPISRAERGSSENPSTHGIITRFTKLYSRRVLIGTSTPPMAPITEEHRGKTHCA